MNLKRNKKGEINLHIVEGGTKNFPAINIGEENEKEEASLEIKKGFNWRRPVVIVVILGCFLILISGFLLKYFISNSYQSCLQIKINNLDKCTGDLKTQSENFAYDKIRMSDAANILLSLQEYVFNESKWPADLSELIKRGYFTGNLSDPETNLPYLYQRRGLGDYTLCFYLSSGVWGANTDKCPKKENYQSYLDNLKNSVEASIATTPEVVVSKTVTVIKTPTGWLNIRKANLKNSEIIGRANTGAVYTVLEEDNAWVKVELNPAINFKGEQISSGWLSKDYLK